MVWNEAQYEQAIRDIPVGRGAFIRGTYYSVKVTREGEAAFVVSPSGGGANMRRTIMRGTAGEVAAWIIWTNENPPHAKATGSRSLKRRWQVYCDGRMPMTREWCSFTATTRYRMAESREQVEAMPCPYCGGRLQVHPGDRNEATR